MSGNASTLRVGMPIYPGCTLLDFAGATQIFSFAAGFEVVWLAPAIRAVKTTEGVEVLPQATFRNPKGPIDILFVPGGGDEVAKVMQRPLYVDFVREAGSRASWAGAVCTGAFIAAAAGLLDGKRATTYWSQRENLALFPKVRVARGYPRWVIDGNRFSGGGISSSIDLALELVNRIAGAAASQTAQLSVQYAPCPPFQSGDPSQAPPEITAAVRKGQQKFIATIRAATLKVVGNGG
jgi:cyclohexyl-isocyanide hydratase